MRERLRQVRTRISAMKPSRRDALVISACGVFFAVFVLFTGITIRSKAAALGKANPRVFFQIIPLTVAVRSAAPETPARAVFRARYEALGTVVLPMGTCHSDLATGVRIRLREKGTRTWLLDERHESVGSGCGPLRAFEFPIIADSRGHEYELEVEGGRSAEVMVRYHILDAIQMGHPFRKAQFLATRGLQFLRLPSAVEMIAILLFAATAALALFGVPASDPPEDPSSRWLGSAVVFLLTLVAAGLFSTLGVDAHHDGILFKPAMDVAAGQMLFRDTFTQYGALTTLLQAGALLLFGPKLLAIRLLTALAYAGSAVFLYLVFAKFLHQIVTFTLLVIWILTAPYFFLTAYPWSSVYALFFQMLATWLLLDRRFFLGGVAAALTFWCRQPVGIFLTIAVVGAWSWLRVLGQISTGELWARSQRLVLGFTAACIPFFAWLATYRAIPDWWNQSIRLAVRFARDNGGSSVPRQIVDVLTNLLPAAIYGQPDHSSIGALSWWSILPVATLIILIKYSLDRSSPSVVLLCFISLASWLQYHPKPDISHDYWASAPMYGLFGLLLFQLTSRLAAPARIAVTLTVLLAIAAPETAGGLAQSVTWWREHDTSVEEPAVLSGLRLTAKEAAFHQRFSRSMARLAAANPQANIITQGPNALYLTYNTRAQNIGIMYVNWGTFSEAVDPGFGAMRRDYIAKHRPIVITDRSRASVPLGYCRQDDWVEDDPEFLYAPCP